MTPAEINPDSISLRVAEMFVSVQGESTRAGMICGFIRLAGCNLRCSWCDTAYAREGGEHMSLAGIMARVQSWRTPLLEITGGEPLLQPGCGPLAEALLARGYTVMIETNGSLPIQALPDGLIRILDLKCPGSGMAGHICWANMDALTKRDEVKFVLADRQDYEWALETMQRHRLDERCGAVLLAPVFGWLDARELAAWMLEDLPPARMQLQLHKLIWPPDARGV